MSWEKNIAPLRFTTIYSLYSPIALSFEDNAQSYAFISLREMSMSFLVSPIKYLASHSLRLKTKITIWFNELHSNGSLTIPRV